LQDYKASNGSDFSYMLYECKNLKDINQLQKWNVTKGESFAHMLYECDFSLSDFKPIKNWKSPLILKVQDLRKKKI